MSSTPAAPEATTSNGARLWPGKTGSAALLVPVVRALIGSVITVGTLS